MKTYLGDGVYAEFEDDTNNVVLTTENGIDTTNIIYLEPEVVKSFREFLQQLSIARGIAT